jgi:hypothetical protein
VTKVHAHYMESNYTARTNKCSLSLSPFCCINVCLPFFVSIDSILRLDGNDIKYVPLVLQRQCGMHKEWACEKVDLEVARIVCDTVDALVS